MIRGFGASWKADVYTDQAAQIVFNNNYDQPSNIKAIGNSIHDFWHLAQTTHFSILLLFINYSYYYSYYYYYYYYDYYYYYFLFRRATANLCACFPLKPIGICFLHHWPAL